MINLDHFLGADHERLHTDDGVVQRQQRRIMRTTEKIVDIAELRKSIVKATEKATNAMFLDAVIRPAG